ncbi:MAG: PilZ domain-containing protein [Sphingomonadaceae bacterium]|nr:PilZ domain-containing protein [Sphingomonadaceae bacterium]
MFEPAILHDGQTEREAHILDLSVDGALLHAHQPPRNGIGITLRFGRTTALGRVAWIAGNHLGVAFLNPLPVTTVEEMVDRGHERSGPSNRS